MSAIVRLPQVVQAPGERKSNAGADHPMRIATREIALSERGWTPERAATVAQVFDQLAPDWHTRAAEPRSMVVEDAFARGGEIASGTWLELGSGSGLVSPWLAERCRQLLAVDISEEMLSRAPAGVGARVRGDGANLPVPDASLDALVLVNAFLFPWEARRSLRAHGVVVWVNTAGSGTPIYLPAEDVVKALGPGWTATASEAGHGTWAVARRIQA